MTYKVKTFKKTKKLMSSLKKVCKPEDIEEEYYHLAVDDIFYVFQLDVYTEINIQYLIDKGLIYTL